MDKDSNGNDTFNPVSGYYDDTNGDKVATVSYSGGNVPGEYSSDGITYDWYRIEIKAEPSHNDSRYIAKNNNKLTSTFKMFPSNPSDSTIPNEDKFACYFDISLKLEKNEIIPTIRTVGDEQGMDENIYHQPDSNYELNQIITDDEALRYGLYFNLCTYKRSRPITFRQAIANLGNDASFIDKINEVNRIRNRSYMTELEKFIDDLANKIKNDRDNHVYFLIDETTITSISSEAETARNSIASYIDNNLSGVKPSLVGMKTDDYISKQFKIIANEIENASYNLYTPWLSPHKNTKEV